MTEKTPRNNGVRITNREIYDKLEALETTVLQGLAKRPTWASLGKLAGLLIAAGGLALALWP
jgi:hypothetical protein